MSEKSNRFVARATINFPALSQPKSINGSAAKYSGCFIIAKDDVEGLDADGPLTILQRRLRRGSRHILLHESYVPDATCHLW